MNNECDKRDGVDYCAYGVKTDSGN